MTPGWKAGTITLSYFRCPERIARRDAGGRISSEKENIAAGPPPTNLRGNFHPFFLSFPFSLLRPAPQTRDITFLFPTTITAIPSQTIAGDISLLTGERRSMKP